MARTYKDLANTPTDELIRDYNKKAQTTEVGLSFLREELFRRALERTNQRMLVVSRRMLLLTAVVTVMTITSTGLVAWSLLRGVGQRSSSNVAIVPVTDTLPASDSIPGFHGIYSVRRVLSYNPREDDNSETTLIVYLSGASGHVSEILCLFPPSFRLRRNASGQWVGIDRVNVGTVGQNYAFGVAGYLCTRVE